MLCSLGVQSEFPTLLSLAGIASPYTREVKFKPARMRIAFDLDFPDPHTGSAVPWAEASWALLKAISEAP